MKSNWITAALFALALFFNNAGLNAASLAHNPEVKIIAGVKRIWLVTDEISVKELTVQVLDAQGRVVIEKTFNSKIADWSFSVECLTEGTYQVHVGGKTTRFVKTSPDA